MTTMNNKISLPPISDILNQQPSSNLTYHIPQYHLPNYYSQPPRPVLPPANSYSSLPLPPAHGQPVYGARNALGPGPQRQYNYTASPMSGRVPLAKTKSAEAQASVPTSPSRSAEASPKFSKASSIEAKDPKRKTRNNLPKETTFVLLKWLNEHLNHPYPNSFEKNQLMLLTGLNQQQLSNWFINARRRKIKLLKDQKRMSA